MRSALSFGSLITAPVSSWDPPTQVKSESTSVATNHRWSPGHRRCGAGSSPSLDEPVVSSLAPQWPISSRGPRKSMYCRAGMGRLWGTRSFGPLRTPAGNHCDVPRNTSPYMLLTDPSRERGNSPRVSSSRQPDTPAGGRKELPAKCDPRPGNGPWRRIRIRSAPWSPTAPRARRVARPVRERGVGFELEHPTSVWDRRRPHLPRRGSWPGR